LRANGDAAFERMAGTAKAGAGITLGLEVGGYGKMGRLIEQLAPEYGFEVRAKFDGRNNASGEGLTRESLQGIDVAVEFTTPHTAVRNVERLVAGGRSAAVGKSRV